MLLTTGTFVEASTGLKVKTVGGFNSGRVPKGTELGLLFEFERSVPVSTETLDPVLPDASVKLIVSNKMSLRLFIVSAVLLNPPISK